ncbi:MAG: TonB-dependent receptor plug domain-containing protein [Gammaproteobacteria bacterium]|nr:TonB-dependent receptor plug domain-containing protein [Gammaproteobacteria bacterium]
MRSILLLTFICLNSTVSAETLETIVVETEADYSLPDPSLGSTSYSRIEMGQTKLVGAQIGEVLQAIPSAQTISTGADDAYTTVQIRGSNSSQVAVFVDGEPFGDLRNQSVNLSQINLSDIEYIDVYRSNVPAQLSKGSIGGAIDIRTSTGLGNWASIAANNHHGKTVAGGFAVDNHTFSFELKSSPNDFIYRFDNRTPLNSDDDRDVKRKSADAQRQHWLYKTKVNDDISLQFGFDRHDQSLPNVFNQTTFASLFKERFNVTATYDNADDTVTQQKLALVSSSSHYLDENSAIGLAEQDEKTKTNGIRYNLLKEFENRHGLLTLNQSIQYQDFEITVEKGFSKERSGSRTEVDTALEQTFFVSDTLSVTPQLRTSYINDSLAETNRLNHSASFGLRKDFEASSVMANISTGFKTPGFDDLYGDYGLWVGNSDLVDERSLTADLRWDRTFELNSLPASFSIGGYVTEADDLIVTTYDSRGIGHPDNIGQATLMGIEASGDVELSEHTAVSANLTLLSTENTSGVIGTDDALLPNRAPMTANLNVSSRIKEWDLHASIQYQSGGYYDSANLLPIEDNTNLSLAVSRQFGQTNFSIRGKNLLDQQAQAINGFPAPGRQLTLQIKHQF